MLRIYWKDRRRKNTNADLINCQNSKDFKSSKATVRGEEPQLTIKRSLKNDGKDQ